MKILHYNWTQFDDPQDFGGGVGVYLQTLIKKTIEAGHQVDFLSSGRHYKWLSSQAAIERTNNSFSQFGMKSFQVVNSPVLAPAHFSFGRLGECFEDKALDALLHQFLEQQGKYDVIHLHNVEGLTFSSIKVMRGYARRLFLTAHNYHLICPQIELFKHGAHRCEDYHDGADCFGCLNSIPDKGHTIKYRKIKALVHRFDFGFINPSDAKSTGKKLLASAKNIKTTAKIPFRLLDERLKSTHACEPQPHTNINKWEQRCAKASEDLRQLSDVHAVFKRWRETGIEFSANVFDQIFAVSTLAKDRLIAAGVAPSKVLAAPIGMDLYSPHEERIKRHREKRHDAGVLNIVFLGYPIASKGLPTLLDRIETIDNTTLKKLQLTICSHLDDVSYRRLAGLRSRVHDIRLVSGYARKDLPAILQGADLGITPSIWWETFNQVSYEMIMLGVPVMMSKHLGIAEFQKNENFLFDPESPTDFGEKLSAILNNRALLNSYWDEEVNLPSFDNHVSKLLKHYAE